MGDTAEQEPFEQIAERLVKELVEEGCEDEASESVGRPYFEYVVKRERIRRGVTEAGRLQDEVDFQTFVTLRNADSDNPQHEHTMLTFQRLGVDPIKAVEYITRVIDEKEAEQRDKQRKRARKPRRGSLSPLSKLIDEIVMDNPKIAVNDLRHELKNHDGIIEIDGELRDTVNTDTIKVKSLKDRLYRAKKRESR